MRYVTFPLTGVVASLILAACNSDTAGPVLRVPEAVRNQNFTPWSSPVSLGLLVNSTSSEQQPTVSKDGLSLYFASGRPIDPGNPVADQNIWVAHRDCADIDVPACAWQAPVALGSNINGPYFDVTPALSRDEHYLFFASQRAHDNCTEPCNRDLWVSYRDDVHDDFAWQAPVHLGSAINSAGEDLAPAYFENEGGQAQLFFTRGLLAAADLYVSVMQSDGSWGTATPITELNSAGIAEARPSLTADGLEMYFWSTRGDGVSHIWKSTRESSTASWSSPVLVASPISDEPSAQPFIYSHGSTQSLYLVRTPAGGSMDLFVSQRTRGGGF
ncbi:MAG: WD40-like Beta Propeller Repeat [Gemmatimonadales bacterium]|nr:WD40-like Beta Propeller Repeat [Gemmatimonadales bacterium]